MSDRNIVENWLKSLDLAKYTQAFLDNGYDDLEICKQVGEPDLDAIGVESGDDREKLLAAVKTLKEKGGTAVYLTLEDEEKVVSKQPPVRPTLDNLLNDVPPPSPSPAQPQTADAEKGFIEVNEDLISYPKLQLTFVIRDKLLNDRIDLASPPYTAQNLAPCWSSLTALAIKYANELRTCVEDVLDRLEDLRWWQITEDTISIYSPPSMTSSTMEDPYQTSSAYTGSPRGGPPPIPSVPPPEASHLDGYGQLQSIQTRYAESPSHANYVALDTGDIETVSEKKKTSTLGRLFRNMGFRRSSRKHSYKKHQDSIEEIEDAVCYRANMAAVPIGDLLAHEITMGDNDRIALMQMVKEGKISTETALQVVKKFEEERKKDDTVPEYTKEKEKKSDKKSKKSLSLKPTKSPSLYSESQCEACNNLSMNDYPATFTTGHQCRIFQDEGCRHRRVHSVSHINYPESLKSPSTGRAMSCSPMRSHSTQNSAVNSPVGYGSVNQASKIYTPVIPHELKMYSGSRGLYGIHGIDMIRDRLNVIKTSTCVHKTQSKASLISSESDHSMECASHQNSQLDPQAEEMYFCSNNSTVSVGSDTLPAMNGRRKCGNAMEKLRNHKWQRTGSVGQCEDGMSTDTEDLDDPDRLLLGGGTSSSHMMEKFRGVRNEMRRRILHTRDIIEDGKSQHLCSAYQTAPGINQSVSSTDSCSSGHGSQSSQPWNDLESQVQLSGPILGIARVHSNYCPSPAEKDFLQLKRGEKVHVLEATSSGIWKGQIDNRVGYFHFNFVDMVTDSTPVSNRKEKSSRRRINRRSKPQTVEELLQRIGLEHLSSVFLMNGYDNLEIFAELDHDDLNALNILDSESRTKLITAAELLVDYNEGPTEPLIRTSRSTSATPTSQQYAVPWTSFFPSSSKPSTGSRDSGCYDSNECMNRENDPYASRNRVIIDKENLRPVVGKKIYQQGLNLNGAKIQNGGKGDNEAEEEKTYTEEDQEVCHITGYQSNQVSRSSPRQPTTTLTNGRDSASSDIHSHYRSINIPALGPDWKVFADSFSQTSPYGSLSDSFHTGQDGNINLGSTMSSSTHGDAGMHNNAYSKKKSKPYARKVTPSVSTKDAQVQVMCPLGLFPLQSPCSPPLINDGISNQSEFFTNQAIVSHSGEPVQFSQLTINQSNNDQSYFQTFVQGGQVRVSYASQNSKDGGDSGSDASTVKSDRMSSGTEQGRSTPDSIYGPIHKGFKSIKRSVIPKVTSKLASENIDLATEPYSTAIGTCGIPPLLVQRYAEELKQDVFKTAVILDQVRMHKLSTLGRPVIPAEQLTEQSLATSELKIATIPEFFTSIGLPMYAESFCQKGFTSVETLSNLPVKQIQTTCKADRKHLKRIVHALEWVQNRLKSPSKKAKSSPVKDKV